MKTFRAFLVVAPLLLVCACSGGGGASGSSSVGVWEKFRHDASNTGQAVAPLATPAALAILNGHIQSVPVDSGSAPAPVSASAAIAVDGSVFVGSEGGTLAAFDPRLNTRWRVTSCACPAATPVPTPPATDLGPMVSSPAVSSLTGSTSIFVGSLNVGSLSGHVFGFTDTGGTQPTCSACFEAPTDEFGTGTTVVASFASSPSFTTNAVVLTVTAVFIGARLDVQPQGGRPRTIGKVYAINNNGTLNWEFPRQGDAEIGAVTSSPALAAGDLLYFTDAGGYLYALTTEGVLKLRTAIGPAADPSLPFAPSPMTSNIYTISPTADGNIFLITADQLVSLHVASGDVSFSSSLALGELVAMTPTPTVTPVGSATPTGPTPTFTATPTAGIPSFVFGVTQAGQVLAMDVNLRTPTVFPTQTPIPAPVISSPALSSDGLLVFGSADGHLHIVDTGTGLEPSGWPVLLVPAPGAIPGAIRSSPSIGGDGTIYVGSDDGRLYAVGLP